MSHSARQFRLELRDPRGENHCHASCGACRRPQHHSLAKRGICQHNESLDVEHGSTTEFLVLSRRLKRQSLQLLGCRVAAARGANVVAHWQLELDPLVERGQLHSRCPTLTFARDARTKCALSIARTKAPSPMAGGAALSATVISAPGATSPDTKTRDSRSERSIPFTTIGVSSEVGFAQPIKAPRNSASDGGPVEAGGNTSAKQRFSPIGATHNSQGFERASPVKLRVNCRFEKSGVVRLGSWWPRLLFAGLGAVQALEMAAAARSIDRTKVRGAIRTRVRSNGVNVSGSPVGNPRRGRVRSF